MDQNQQAAGDLGAVAPQGWLFALGTFFYSGAVPFAPGTFGSIATALIIAAVEVLVDPVIGWWVWLLAGGLVGVAGVPVGAAVERAFGAKDPGWFVLDEVAGVLIAYAGGVVALELFGLPEGLAGWATPLTIFVSLAVFRAYDIAKPWPVRRVERIGGGIGIMADDVVAGVMAACTTAGLVWLAGV